MPTILEAAKTSQNPFTVLGFKSIAYTNEMFSLINFVPKRGESFQYTREKSVGSFGFIADNYNGDIAESTGTDEVVVVPKREAVADFYISQFAEENQADIIRQSDRQKVKKMKAAGITLADKLINGKNITTFTIENFQSGAYVTALLGSAPGMDTTRHGPGEIKYTHAGTKVQFRGPGEVKFGPEVTANANGNYLLPGDNPTGNWIYVTLTVAHATADATRRITFGSASSEFDGLKALITTRQVRASKGANGDQPTHAILDELIDAVKVRTPGKMAFLMNAGTRRKYEAIDRAMGGASPFTLPSGIEVPKYKGIPLLTNDFILNNESKGTRTDLTSIYLVNLADEEGFWMGALGGASFDVQADPSNVAVLGFRLIFLGPIQKGSGNKFGYRLAWYGAPALGSDLAAARAAEIDGIGA